MKKIYIVLLIGVLICPLLGCQKKENKPEENTPIVDSGDQKSEETHDDGIYTCISKKMENVEFKDEYTIKDNTIISYKTTVTTKYKELAKAMYDNYLTLDFCHNLNLSDNVITYTNDTGILVGASFSALRTSITSDSESYEWQCE